MTEAGPNPRSDPTAAVIELKIREVGQLFHTLDPLPFRERDLDAGVEEYVVSWARELPAREAIRIIIHLPVGEANKEGADHVASAINSYFASRAEAVSLELREMFRIGRTSLVIGLCVLALCSMGGRLAGSLVGPGYLGGFLSEGLVILGWVANWRPVQIFLYDWWPLARRRKLLHRLAKATVQLTPITHAR